MANIHGFRVFSPDRCERTSGLILRGMSNMHLHTRVQKAAECNGISAAMWMTQTARDHMNAKAKGGPEVPHEGTAPDWDCTCGHYGYRTLADAWTSPSSVYAHVTCLERTILHTSGWRTTRYSIDYLLAATEPNQKVYIRIENPSQAQGRKVVPIPTAGPWGWFGGMTMLGEEREYEEVLSELALVLGVPVLEKEDLKGCPVCIVVNGWRDEKEVTPQMHKDWFGAGYQ